MERTDAERVVSTFARAWDWDIPPDQRRMWVESIAEWESPDAAEVAVIELFQQMTSRPKLGELRLQYQAVRRRFEEEDRAERNAQPKQLPPSLTLPSTPDKAWSPEGARFAVALAKGAVFDGVVYEGQPPRPTLKLADVEEAERKARERWEQSGTTTNERIQAAKKGLSQVGAKVE